MRTLKLKDGGRLDFHDDGSGPAIVCLHGWSLGKEAFERQRGVLRHSHRFVAPDLRGHGASSPFCAGDSIAVLADDVAQLLVARDISDAVLVGWSMGALVAWQVALGGEGRRVAGIVTIDMVPKVLNRDGWTHGLRAGASFYDPDLDLERMRSDWTTFAKAYVPKVFARKDMGERDELIEWMTARVANNDVSSMMRLWRSLIAADFVSEVRALDLPTMITYGSQSQVYDEEAALWMEKNMPNACLVALRESGHAPHLEEPDKFNEALVAFTKEVADGVESSRALSC